MKLCLHYVMIVFHSVYGNKVLEELQILSIRDSFIKKVRETIPDDDIKSICQQQIVEYAKSLQQLEPWALQMFDATGKPPSGILEGNCELGSFDQCLDVSGPTDSQFVGQYCLGEILITGANNFYNTKEQNDTMEVYRISSKLTQAFCVPSGCSAEAITFIWKQFGYNISILENNCQTKPKQPEFDIGAIVSICIFCMLLLALLVSTAYDSYFHYAHKDVPINVLTTFSILSNGKQLLSSCKNVDVIGCLHGIRVLSTMWIIVFHLYLVQLDYPLKNQRFFKTMWKLNVRNMFFICGTHAVDTFFLLGGLTLSYSYRLTKNKRKFNILHFYIHRYLRLTPVLAVVILFYATLFKYMGTGPFWPATTLNIVEPCKTNWWRTLFYIQNYAPSKMVLNIVIMHEIMFKNNIN